MAVVLVSGSRTIIDQDFVFSHLDQIAPRPDLVLFGDAGGVDRLANLWCRNPIALAIGFAAEQGSYP